MDPDFVSGLQFNERDQSILASVASIDPCDKEWAFGGPEGLFRVDQGVLSKLRGKPSRCFHPSAPREALRCPADRHRHDGNSNSDPCLSPHARPRVRLRDDRGAVRAAPASLAPCPSEWTSTSSNDMRASPICSGSGSDAFWQARIEKRDPDSTEEPVPFVLRRSPARRRSSVGSAGLPADPPPRIADAPATHVAALPSASSSTAYPRGARKRPAARRLPSVTAPRR